MVMLSSRKQAGVGLSSQWIGEEGGLNYLLIDIFDLKLVRVNVVVNVFALIYFHLIDSNGVSTNFQKFCIYV